ncbi:MAG TPA: gliding motility-associated ABC transporter substrate-binding protein GldG [Prolixibacteraceae bacterium]|nr:gliding motility-associated ABC transporter substrate-binding protein GldG [Prolixibacteraceae bacterium]
MTALFKKEILQFFGSVTGYLVMVAFLLTGGLFLWVFPGNYNIPDSGYASLEPFFQLAPWLYLFLIPAITMRLFSEEKKSGTIELLFTSPLGDLQLVLAKFLSALVVVSLSLLPTLIWYISLILLGNPVGNIDHGSFWGAFTGLFLLASIFTAIGLFASSITENQMVAFILGLVFSFVSFLGFEFIASSGLPYSIEKIFSWLSVNDHYLSVSRGVIDLRDTTYFLGMSVFFLLLTLFFLRADRVNRRRKSYHMGMLLIFLVVLAILSNTFHARLDLTTDKRYSLSPPTRKLIKSLDEPLTIELFLNGELQPGFRKLRQAIQDKVIDFRKQARVPVRLVLTDPYEAASGEKQQELFRKLESDGIRPFDIRRKTNKGTETTRIFPGATLTLGERKISVGFLMNNPGLNHEVNLNHSVENVEYALASGLKILMTSTKPKVVFLQGNGECNPYEVGDLANALASGFKVEFLDIQAIGQTGETPRVVVIADPVKPFSETEKFIVDQLVMRGSRLLWLIDPVQVSLDSLSNGFMTLAFPRDLNLDDQLFQYGIRLNRDLVQDVSCATILVNTASSSDRPDFTPQPWYYSPLLTPSADHPVSRSLNQVMSEFVSSIDTIGGRAEQRFSVLLHTSAYSRQVRTPAIVSLESINAPPARELFNKSAIPTGILVEGVFHSVFRNRLLNGLQVPVADRKLRSPETKMMVFSDGHLIANKVRYPAGGQPELLPLGYDMVSRQTFGNRDFFVNAIQYLADDEGIMDLRNTTFSLRLLDKVKLREEGVWWRWINIGSPLLLIFLFAFGFTFFRNRKQKKHI